MPRLFVAVLPPEDVLDTLEGLSRPEVPGVRWTARNQWHVTLRFLGTTEVAPVVEALKSEPLARLPLQADLGPAVGRFENRVLMVPVAGLDTIARRAVEATAGLGRPPETRAFTGHLTLARVRGASRVDLRPLAGEPVEERWWVDEVCLVESRLATSGPRYDVIQKFALA